MYRLISSDSLQFEDFDIVNMIDWFPNMTIGVSVNRIYIQIAKYHGRNNKQKALKILSNSLSRFDAEEYMMEPKYVVMSMTEVKTCFGDELKKLPKKTFINIKNTCNENNEVYKYLISEETW